MDADHPITLVLCVVAMLLAIIVGAQLFERWMLLRRRAGWLEVALFAAAALAFGAGAAFVPDVSRPMRVWIATAAVLFAFGSLGAAFQWPGFRPPSQDEAEDDLEDDEDYDKGGTQ